MRALIALLATVATAHAAEHRLLLADASDFAAKRGFVLALENRYADGTVGKLPTLRITLGAANGNDWRFIEYVPNAAPGALLAIGARIADGKLSLRLNGKEVASGEGRLRLRPGTAVRAATVPEWANGAIDYQLTQTRLAIKAADLPPRIFGFDDNSSSPLYLFERSLPRDLNVAIPEDAAIDIEALVNVAAAPDLRRLAPFVDRYGQSVYGDWKGKVRTDEDLRNAMLVEGTISGKWERPKTWDRFGGTTDAGWKGTATGVYSTAKRNGAWWMVSPQGNPLFYTGICTAPSLLWDRTPVSGREFLWAEFPKEVSLYTNDPWNGGTTRYFAQHSANLVRTFGATWKQKAEAQTANRIRRWGFTGMGKWSDPLPNTPHLPVLNLVGVPKAVRHADVFDPAVVKKLESVLGKQITPLRNSPWVVGWSIGNEFDEIITTQEIRDVLAQPKETPLKKALLEEASRRGMKAGDFEPLRQFYAKRYYQTLYKTVKRLDPKHLYFGFWIVPGWWENESDWDLIAPYCDVIGFDRYSESWAGMEKLLARYDKPVLLGEFSFPAWYGGERGYGRYQVSRETDADSGRAYAKLMADASRDPKCIGALWFQYRDQPITGRGPGSGPQLVLGEHYAFGFVDLMNRPKWDLVNAARTANLRATTDRRRALK